LGGVYHVAHGECNYEFFTPIFKTYTEIAPDGKIKRFNNLVTSTLGLSADDDIYEALDTLLNTIFKKQKLRDFGMKEDEVLSFTDSVIEKQQRLLSNHYVPISKEKMIEIYKSLY